jgi:hypothetical protein
MQIINDHRSQCRAPAAPFSSMPRFSEELLQLALSVPSGRGRMRRIARSVRHPILSTITKELFNFRSRAQGYLALFPELQARRAGARAALAQPQPMRCAVSASAAAPPCLAQAGVGAGEAPARHAGEAVCAQRASAACRHAALPGVPARLRVGAVRCSGSAQRAAPARPLTEMAAARPDLGTTGLHGGACGSAHVSRHHRARQRA